MLAGAGAVLVSSDAVGRAPSRWRTRKTMQELYAAPPALRVVFVGRRPSGSIDAATTLVGLKDGDVMRAWMNQCDGRAGSTSSIPGPHAFSPSRVLFVRAEDLSERSYALAEDLFAEVRASVVSRLGKSGVVDAPRAEPLSRSTASSSTVCRSYCRARNRRSSRGGRDLSAGVLTPMHGGAASIPSFEAAAARENKCRGLFGLTAQNKASIAPRASFHPRSSKADNPHAIRAQYERAPSGV